MTADERPTVPPDLDPVSREAVRELADREPATLRSASDYLEALAAWKARRDEGAEDTATDDSEPDAYPDGVPEHATVSVTEIGDIEYYYYQWREGDEIRSETVER
ncbi:hypothetical protein [Natrinema salsiterrestre]|uniref:Uncharacterized protein n=1 Tax=Natrinema salsiterrestre TaxID=2950540 RepID=A0A9Q4KZY7_9EURY|nr:hypothetical protein [Natrinema salsiterrestre]MDF9744223.1 hypothetical protein [Natrinema salsiterrestre]